jgi:hypothetical protein
MTAESLSARPAGRRPAKLAEEAPGAFTTGPGYCPWPQYRTDAMLTLDRRDLRAVRPLTPHKWFRLLPDELQQ